METIHAYVNRIKQAATLFNYGEPQILELIKTPYLAGYIGFIFINDLTDTVDMAKGVLTTEKIDRQLSGRTGTTTPFMKVGDGHHSNNKTVSFSTQDPIREQLDSLTSMVYNLSIQKKETTDH